MANITSPQISKGEIKQTAVLFTGNPLEIDSILFDISMADAKKAGLATKATIIVFVRSQARSDGGTELWVDHVAYGGVWSSLDLDVLYARSMAVVLDCVNEKGRKIMESAGRA